MNEKVVLEELVLKRVACRVLRLDLQTLSDQPNRQPGQPRDPRLMGVDVIALLDLQRHLELARRIAQMDPFALRMAKQAVNRTLDTMGQWTAMEAVFDMHHLAHAQSRIVHSGDLIAGQTVESMKSAGAGKG